MLSRMRVPVILVARTIAIFLLVLWSTSRGGGNGGVLQSVQDGSPSPSKPPFGLTVRKPLSTFTLPTERVALGSFDLVNLFPKLSFANALFLSGIPGEDRLVVVQQSGFVRAFVNNSSTTSSHLVLDLSGRVEFSGEQGLLGLAFDPEFVQNRYIYVHYSMQKPRRSVISRFSWNVQTDAVDLGTEKVLLEIDQPFRNHNGGMLAFGPDDLFYIAMGDGGSGGDPQNNAQDPSSLLGSMLRIDVHPIKLKDRYDIPLDNPAFSQPGARPETYAIGFRNPFRFSFDRATGDLWLGDVGQAAIEEIDVVKGGGNYGWRVFEGSQAFDGSANALPSSAFTPPVHEYGHPPGVAVIGGYVYRGNALPSLQGRYLYSDFGPGTIWALDYDGVRVISNDVIATANSPTSFGEDNQGEIYIVTRNNGIFGLVENNGSGGTIPDALSKTGLFTDLASLQAADGLIEYGINHPFWSDNTIKRRWLGVPDAGQIKFSATGGWTFPVGSIAIKHFELELTEGDPASRRRLETRLLVHTSDGWQGFTYRWNAQGTDAELLTGRETEMITLSLVDGGTRDQLYEYPSRTDCLGCHTEAAGRTLGLVTRQLNQEFDYPNATDNQLRSWNNIGLFSADIGDETQYPRFAALDDNSHNLQSRARAYLHINCAMCHQPNGPTPVDMDLRFDTALTAMNALGVVPSAGDLGIANPLIIAAGDKERSVLWARMQVLDGNRMPPLSSHLLDTEAIALVGEWIDSL